ncbi:MAG: hypothetical protein L3J65_12070 [Robiginitomaculum sp.]|nr:hypothetical protein [Robiginitomaculum sp.]
MSQWNLIYHSKLTRSPLSYWVHIPLDASKNIYCAELDWMDFKPPFLRRIPVKGYPYLIIRVTGFNIEFASLVEVQHCLDILSQKNMPTTMALSKKRATGVGPNGHWLSRWPANLKSWSKRQKIVAALERTKTEMMKKGIEF